MAVTDQLNKLLILDDLGFPRVTTHEDRLVIDSDFVFKRDVKVEGNLVVEGNVVSRQQENVVVRDAFMDLGVGAQGAQVTGLDFIVEGKTPHSAIEFIASNANGKPAIKMASAGDAALYAAGEIIQVYNSHHGENEGLFVVDAINGDEVELKVAPAATAPFAQTSLRDSIDEDGVTPIVETASISKVDLYVLRITNGVLEEASAADATEGNLSYYPVGASSTTLQDAYDNSAPAEIRVDAGKNISFYLENAGAVANFEVKGSATGQGSTFLGSSAADRLDAFQAHANSINMASHQGDFSLTSNSANTIKMTVGTTLEAEAKAGSFEVKTHLQSLGTATIDGDLTAVADFYAKGSSFIGDDAAVDVVEFTAKVDSDMLLKQDAVHSSGSLTEKWLAVYSEDLHATSLTQSKLVLSGANGQLLSAEITYDAPNNKFVVGSQAAPEGMEIWGPLTANGGFTAGGSTLIDMGANKVTNVADPVNPQDAVTLSYLQSANNAQALDIKDDQGNAYSVNLLDDDMEIAGTTDEIEVVLSENQASAPGVPSIKTFTIGLPSITKITTQLEVLGTGQDALKSAGGADIEGKVTIAGILEMDAQSAASIQKTPAPGSSGEDLQIELLTAEDAALKLYSEGFGGINLMSTNGSISMSSPVDFDSSAGFQLEAGEALNPGEICYIHTDGKAYKADNAAAYEWQRGFHAAAIMGMAIGDILPFSSVAGTKSRLAMASAPTSADIGKPVYLESAGKASLVAPTASGSTVFKVGILMDASADADGNFGVVLQPQFIAKRP